MRYVAKKRLDVIKQLLPLVDVIPRIRRHCQDSSDRRNAPALWVLADQVQSIVADAARVAPISRRLWLAVVRIDRRAPHSPKPFH